jgi:hypothetical protein
VTAQHHDEEGERAVTDLEVSTRLQTCMLVLVRAHAYPCWLQLLYVETEANVTRPTHSTRTGKITSAPHASQV